MNKILEIGLNFTFVIGASLTLYSLLERTNFNKVFSIALCFCSVHWICDTFEKIILEDKYDS